jgi:hypothetical protein
MAGGVVAEAVTPDIEDLRRMARDVVVEEA